MIVNKTQFESSASGLKEARKVIVNGKMYENFDKWQEIHMRNMGYKF